MSYIGDYAEDYATLNIKFTTAANGVPTTLAGTPVVSVYKGNDVTQSAAGITLTVDFDSVTGKNNVLVDLSSDAFYATGQDYQVVITTGTVAGISVVGYVVAEFSIENRFTRGAAQIDKMAYVGPHGLGVWIDDGAANTNTVLGTDGTPDNPVSTIAAATTIAASLGSQFFYFINDTQLTLAQTYEGYEFIGIGIMNKVTLDSQDVDNSHFESLILTGTQGGTQFMQAFRCQLQALLSAEIVARDCELTGDITLRVGTNHSFINCSSATPGGGAPDLNFPGAGGATTVNVRNYSGGLTIKNARLNDVMSYDCPAGQLIIDASCTSLEIHVRGNCTITDNGTTTILTQDAAVTRTSINEEVVDVLETDTHAEPSGVVAATTSIKDALMWLKALSRNKGTQTSTTKTSRNDADDADIGTAAISDDGTTFTREKWS